MRTTKRQFVYNFFTIDNNVAIENIIRDSEYLKNMSKQGIMYELKIKVTRFKDGFHLVSEVSKKNKKIFKEFSIPIPGN